MKILFTTFVTIFALIALSACSFKESYKNAYTLQIKPQTAMSDASACSDKTLKVSQLFSSTSLMSTKMSYVEGGYHEYAFSQSEWAQSPNSIITQKIISSLRASGLFKSVEGHKSRSKSDYILESTLEDFRQYFSEDAKSSFVSVVMHFVLIDAKSSEVITSKSVSKKIELQTLEAKEGVTALSEATSEIFEQKNRWLSEECR